MHALAKPNTRTRTRHTHTHTFIVFLLSENDLPWLFSSQAEARAEFAERSVQKLQKEVDRLEGIIIFRFYLPLKFFFFPFLFLSFLFIFNSPNFFKALISCRRTFFFFISWLKKKTKPKSKTKTISYQIFHIKHVSASTPAWIAISVWIFKFPFIVFFIYLFIYFLLKW
jgi:hypothetical protein